MPLVASFQVADGLAGSCGGVLRGQGQLPPDYNAELKMTVENIGRQHLGALFNTIAYYVLALPLGITMAFHPRLDLGLQGLWIGMCFESLRVSLAVFNHAFRSSCRVVYCWNRRVLHRLAWD